MTSPMMTMPVCDIFLLVVLAADVALGQKLELVGLKHGAGNFAVLDMKRERRLAARAGEERIRGMDVALGLQERGENGLQVGRAAG